MKATAEVCDVTGRPVNEAWRITTPGVVREGIAAGSIVTRRWRTIQPLDGKISVDLEPGLAIIEFDETQWLVDIPNEDADLWEIIATAVAFPPDTNAQAVASAVTTFLEGNPVTSVTPEGITDSTTVGRALITAEDAAAAQAAIGGSTPGRTVFSGNAAQGREALGSTELGSTVFTAATALAARVALAAVGKGDLVINVKDYGALGNGAANDTAAINAAIDALVPGATLFFPPGRYMTNGGHVIDTPSVVVKGCSGRAQTYNSAAQLYLRNAANADMMTIAETQITVRDLALFGNKTNQSGTSRGLVTSSAVPVNYFLLDAVWVDSFNGDGFAFEGGGSTVSSTIVNCESRVNAGYGMRFYGTATDSMMANCYVDQNGLSGIQCSSGDLSVMGCHIWGNGTAGSGDRDGITFQSAAGCRVVNCYIETNHNGAGIRFKSGTNRGHIVTECDIWDNGNQGIYAFAATNCIFSNNVIRTNNYNGGSGVNGAALVVDSCTSIIVEGNQFFNASLNRQTYCFYENGSSNAEIAFTGNACRRADQNGQNTLLLGPGTLVDLGTVSRRKTADQSVTSSTTLIDDLDLTFAVAVGEVWEIEGMLFVDGATSGDVLVRLAAPSTPTGYWRALGPAASNTSASAASFVPGAQLFNQNATIGALGAGVIATVKFEGMLTVTTVGTFVVRWAQGTSDATATIVKAGSYLRARRVMI